MKNSPVFDKSHSGQAVVGVATTSMMSFAMMGTTVFVPLFFQLVLGFSPAAAGLLLLPQIAMMVISSIVGGCVPSFHCV